MPTAERELKRVQAKVGELTMKLEIVEWFLEQKRLRGGVEEVETLRGAVSPGTHARYTVTLICEALHAPRSSVYAAGVAPSPTEGGKRGPKTALTDAALVVEIRALLAACPFHSEGHRKVHARLRAKSVCVGRKRVLRLMRAHHLLAPSRPRHEHGDPAHAGTIITRSSRSSAPTSAWPGLPAMPSPRRSPSSRTSRRASGWSWAARVGGHPP